MRRAPFLFCLFSVFAVVPSCVTTESVTEGDEPVTEASAAITWGPPPLPVSFGGTLLDGALVPTLVAPGDNLLAWNYCEKADGARLADCVALSIGEKSNYAVYFVTPTTGVTGAVYNGRLVLDRIRVKISGTEDYAKVTMTNAVSRTFSGSAYSYMRTGSLIAEVMRTGPGSYHATTTYKNGGGTVLGTSSFSRFASIIPGNTCAQEAALIESALNVVYGVEAALIASTWIYGGASLCVAGALATISLGTLPACTTGLAIGGFGLTLGTFFANVLGTRIAAFAGDLYDAACTEYGWADDSPGGAGGVGGLGGSGGSTGTGGMGGFGGGFGGSPGGPSGGSGCGDMVVGAFCIGGTAIYPCDEGCCMDSCPGLIDETCECVWDANDCETEVVACPEEILPPTP